MELYLDTVRMHSQVEGHRSSPEGMDFASCARQTKGALPQCELAILTGILNATCAKGESLAL
jgi:hypothetical protein